MSITSVSALGGGFNFNTGPYVGSSSGTRSVTHQADGATVTTLRGPAGDVVSVTTAASSRAGAAQVTVDVTA